jgi:putative ABC transport system permease protein
MNVISRGIRNAFRNTVRTFSLVIILGLSIGLSLTMLIAHQAVSDKINSVKGAIGNTITIAPAGFSGFSQVNNALSTTQLDKVAALPHITKLSETLTDRLTTIGSTQPSAFNNSQSSNTNNTTSLTSPVTFNSSQSGGGGGRLFIAGGGALPANFTPPITVLGTNDPMSAEGSTLALSSGKSINGSTDSNDVLVSTAMASKNNLKAGSTFTAYGTTLTVAGIFTSDSQGTNGTVIMSLPAAQRLSGQAGDVTNAVATVDSLDNLSSVTAAIKNTLGSNTADVTSSVDQANQTLQPLDSVKNISLYSLVGAVVAGGMIILLTMVMIVRERRREIGVIKAIGASNLKVMLQFMVEAVTLTVLAAVVGIILGVVAGNPITHLLVTSSNASGSSNSSQSSGGAGKLSGGGFQSFGSTTGHGFGAVRNNFSNIHAAIGWSIILDGLAAAIIIALVGSSLAAFFIAKIRPAEVMRVE